MKRTYPLNELEIPLHIIERDGPFSECRPDASFVSVQLNNGKKVNGVLMLYPNYIIAIEGENELRFSPRNVVRIIQTEEDLKRKPSSKWSFLYNPEELKTGG